MKPRVPHAFPIIGGPKGHVDRSFSIQEAYVGTGLIGGPRTSVDRPLDIEKSDVDFEKTSRLWTAVSGPLKTLRGPFLFLARSVRFCFQCIC